MLQEFKGIHTTDDDGKPSGGTSMGLGLSVIWQNGPLGRGDDRKEPNGAFVETVIAVAKERIEWYQASGFECAENQNATYFLEKALGELAERTKSRELAGVEGTHERRAG